MTQSEIDYIREALTSKNESLLQEIVNDHNELVRLRQEQAQEKPKAKTKKEEK